MIIFFRWNCCILIIYMINSSIICWLINILLTKLMLIFIVTLNIVKFILIMILILLNVHLITILMILFFLKIIFILKSNMIFWYLRIIYNRIVCVDKFRLWFFYEIIKRRLLSLCWSLSIIFFRIYWRLMQSIFFIYLIYRVKFINIFQR